MLCGLVPRTKGLITKDKLSSSDMSDVPVNGWRNGQVVVDIAGLPQEIQAVVVARTVERLLREAEEGSIGVGHLVLMMDELNAFAPSQGSEMATIRKMLQRVATQGRYAGVSLWGAGQKGSKVDELIRDNVSTRALGIISENELSSGAYGKLPNGLRERIATLPKVTKG